MAATMTFKDFAKLLGDGVQIADTMSMGPKVEEIIRKNVPRGVDRVATTVRLYNVMAANGLTKFADELEGLLTIGNPMVLSLCTIDLLGSDPKEDARQIAQRDRLRKAWKELLFFSFHDRDIWLACCGSLMLFGLAEELPTRIPIASRRGGH